MSKQKQEMRNEAQALAKEKGVPLVHAYRIIKGQTSLNEVLKGMMRKERFEHLVRREGIDRELAGQVASGHLSKQRAVTLTRMRTLRGEKLHVDAIKIAEGAEHPVAIDVFAEGWVVGKVTVARPYDFDFVPQGGAEHRMLYKHDVKAICSAADLPAVKQALTQDESVKGEGLVGTEARDARVRPDDEWMLQLAGEERIVRFTMRDGEAMLGRIRSFGRWDAELVLPGGETLAVFFHGLHPTSVRLGQASA